MSSHSTRRLSTNEVTLLLHNLYVMLHSGMPIGRSLDLLLQDARASMKVVILHIRTSIEQGKQLADAMATSPRAFPLVAISLIRTGEMSGNLAHNLEEVVKHLRKSDELKRKILNALLYPSFIMIAVLGLGLSTGTLVLPKLIPLFDSLEVKLSWSTRLLLFVAAFMKDWGMLTSFCVFISIIAGIFLVRIEKVKPLWHRILLSIPVIGRVIREAVTAQIATTLSVLLSSGIPLHDAVIATANATENRPMRAALQNALKRVENGQPLSLSLENEKEFPHLVVALISTGEETGNLSEMLQYLSEYYEEQTEFTVKNLTTMLEPALLIGIGILVGFVILSILSPIYSVTGSI